MTAMGAVVAKFVPRQMRSEIKIIRELRRLGRKRPVPLEAGRLMAASGIDRSGWLASPAADAAWQEDGPRLSALLTYRPGSGSMSDIDRRALYYLHYALAPARVLEIGTHLGASTLHIASALERARKEDRLADFQITTVDIRDVNDAAARPWAGYGARYSPRELIEEIGAAGRVKFVTSPSLAFLADATGSYDLIFLDGSHDASVVYEEVPMALGQLAEGGTILLHDYHKDVSALRNSGLLTPGPFLAMSRIENECPAIDVLALGELPWTSRQSGQSATSLALVVRR